MTRIRSSPAIERSLPATAATRGPRSNRGGLELLEVLEHADHRVAGRRVRLVRDRAAEADAELGAELGLDQSIGAERLFRIVVGEIGFAAGSRNPDRSEGSSTTTGLRDSEIFDRAAQPLADQWHRGQRNQTIIIVVGPT